MLIEVFSNYGTFLVSRSGLVKDVELDAEFGALPVYVNWAEWRKAYPGEALPSSVDILDIGFINADGVYIEPEHEWRSEYRDIVKEAAENAAKLQRFMSLVNDADQLLVDNAYPVFDWKAAVDVAKEYKRVLAFSYISGTTLVESVFSASCIYNGRFEEDHFVCQNSDGRCTRIAFLRTTNLMEPSSC